jgi:hypothetical protein
MDKTIKELIKNTYQFREYLKTNRINLKAKTDEFRDLFENQVHSLQKIKHKDNYDVKLIIQKFPGQLFIVHDTLVGKLGKVYMNKDELSNLRKAHDLFFIKFLEIKISPRKRFANLATMFTTDFCKGITFFANNSGIEQVPFYHRDTSCGSFDRSSLKNPIFVKNCYIERLIYDQIYSKIFMEQDVSHRVELGDIERLYEKMYPGENLTIKVSFSDDIHPDSVV